MQQPRLTFWIFLLGLTIAGCSGPAQETQRPATQHAKVETLLLEPTRFEDIIEMTGSVEAIDDATLSAQASGTIEYLADLGTPVARGAVVARLNNNEEQAAVAQAQAQLETAQSQLELAQSNYNRLEPLYQDSVISAQEFESTRSQLQQAKASVNQAKASLAQARQRLENTRLRAPFPGTVEEHFFELGEQVSPGQQVVRVTDVTPAKITAGVPERYSGDIERSTPVTARFKAYGDFRRTGQITFVGSTINPQSRTFRIEVNIPNADRRLKPEMVAQLHLTREVLESALVVPREAILRDEMGQHVYIVDRVAPADTTTSGSGADSTAIGVVHQRDVTVGPSHGEEAVIESGLVAGDEVVITGQGNLAPDDSVAISKQHRSLPPPETPAESPEPPALSETEEYDETTGSNEMVE